MPKRYSLQRPRHSIGKLSSVTLAVSLEDPFPGKDD